ncbi:MAG: addiction module protein [Gemmatimonadaceae bacterium]|nr:addiction module protein [Gemmatimonadaceae bacterium]
MKLSLDDIDYWKLSIADRLVLVQDILDSVLAETHAEPLAPQQGAQIDRRTGALDSGEMNGEPWETVRERLIAR